MYGLDIELGLKMQNVRIKIELGLKMYNVEIKIELGLKMCIERAVEESLK